METLSSLVSLAETLNTAVQLVGLNFSVTGVLGVEGELEKLRKTITRIHATLKDAEDRIITDEFVLGWLADLRDLAFEADDLIDEFQTRLEIHDAERKGSRKRKRSWYNPCSLLNSFWIHRWQASRRISDIKETYDDILAAKEKLPLKKGDGQMRVHEDSVPPAASLEGSAQILGRNEQKDQILGLLSHPPVIAIIGDRGIGKTRLAKLVYDDQEVRNLSYEKIWIDVSQDFDERRIVKEIVDSIARSQSDLSNLDLQNLQLQLKMVATQRKILLVLDGMYTEEQSFWEILRDPLAAAAEGSRIIVTARSEIVLKNVPIFYKIQLNPREEMRKKYEILRSLQQDSRCSIPRIVAIIGAGGIGKTTLARLVFSDTEIESFKKIWIGVSRDHDVKRITKEIIEAIEGKNCDDLSMDLLQRQLKMLVAGQKFLLVLDNVWNESQSFWETLWAPLKFGSAGSRILVTAQSESILRYVLTLDRKNLSGLDLNISMSLLMNYAFHQGSWDRYPHLVNIGEAIAEKCRGSPLAIISIGSLLRTSAEEEHWESVLSNMAEFAGEEKMFLTLKVNYDYLPVHLKRCFRFCSIFTNGYEFDREELVKLWIAVGLIQPKGKLTPEYLGGRYFDNLLWRSFFQTCVGHKKPKPKFTMPGLVLELAESVSSNECLRIENDQIPSVLNRQPVSGQEKKNFRYALLYDCKKDPHLWQKIYQNEGLRALLLHGESFICKEILGDIFENLICLWALDLRNNKLTEVPDSISRLVHLRYLNLHGNAELERLPESLSHLYNLQVLELGNCLKFQELPQDLGYLVHLRHLGLHVDWEIYKDLNDLRTMPAGMDRLASLRTLSRFVVVSSKDKCNLTELKRLDLHGEICISKLENVVVADQVKEAGLNEKRYLNKMMLRWSKSTVDTSEGTDACLKKEQRTDAEKVIEHLCPHQNMKYLWIENYPGTSFPNWLGVQSLRLETLILSNCGTCEVLLPVDIQICSLKRLEIRKCPKLTILPGLPSLQKLVLDTCDVLDLSADNQMDSVEQLEIRKCPKLSTLPRFPSLQELVVDECRAAITSSIFQLTSLSSLTMSRFSKLKRMPRAIGNLPYLRKLHIDRCGFDLLALKDLVSLQSLVISECTNLLSFTNDGLPSTLQYLQLNKCDEFKSLPTGLQSLTFLHTLDIQGLPKLTSLPAGGMHPALKNLTISECPNFRQ